uniref:Guanylate cyclase n=1 Tax=Denticeps clupeoides TaxID=299321 RepID=A0AAY4BLW6_9TELE
SAMQLLFWLVVLLLTTLSLPCLAPSPVFRVGILGPWSCDPLFAKAQPRAAANLAVQRINRDHSLSLGTTFDYIILEEDCQTSMGIKGFLGLYTRASAFIGPVNPGYCEAASLVAKNWNKALFSWACINYELENIRQHPTFARTVPSPVRVLIMLVRYFRWANIAILASADDVWTNTASKVADVLRSHGLPVRMVLSASNDPSSIRSTLSRIRKMKELRLIILCMHSVLIGGETQRLILETALDMHMIDGSLVFMPYDTLLYSLPFKHVTYPALRNNGKLRRAYDSVLTVTMDSDESSFYQAYENAIKAKELPANVLPHQVSPLFGTIYSSILFLANAMQNVREANSWLSGVTLASQSRNIAFYGFSQRIRTNRSSIGMLDYVVLDTDGFSPDMTATHRVDMEVATVRFLGRSIHFPGGSVPKPDASCWFTSGSLCHRGLDPFLLVSVLVSAFLTIVLLSALIYFVRRRIGKIRLLRGPNKILLTLSDVTFINPSLSNKFISLQFYDSNIVMFLQMKDIRHENMNPFLGFFLDCGVFAVVTEFCSRGSLQDLLHNEDVKLDWMFKSSLVLDLIKGMKYLHHRNLCHGRLKSRNCVVDGRFVLKVTDYCYNEVLRAQRFPYEDPPAEDLLWTAPEILRGPQPGLVGTLSGDIYSFSIIVQEVVLRGPPFCSLHLPAEEVIQKVKKPPPLCRPVVSPDYAPMECIQLIKQCWNEQPERRPDFNAIFDQFKDINKGRKTNIIDSMLRMLEQYSSNLEELIRERTEELEIEKQKTEKLLTQMLPPSVAEALKVGCTVEPEYFDSVSLYFSDIVGFTTISANSEPIDVVDLLNDLYTIFDAIIGNHDVYKVETIGDAYMVASGVPMPNGNRHAAEIANMALDILSAVGTFKMRHMPDVPVRIRIGLHSGPCVAGVVGLTMPRYCLFGDTVTTASRMESTGMPYRIHVSDSIVKILMELKEGYKVQLRGKAEPKGKSSEDTYWLVGRDGFTKPLPIPPEIKSRQMAHGLQLEEIARSKKKKAESQLAQKK